MAPDETLDETSDETPPETPGAQVLASAECWELLRQSVVGRLAVVDQDGQPDIFPINHVVDHGSVVFRTAVGTKLDASVGRSVAFEVDGYEVAEATAWSVVLKGVAREIWDVDETIATLSLPLYPWLEGSKPRLVRVQSTGITGRRFAVKGGTRSTPA